MKQSIRDEYVKIAVLYYEEGMTQDKIANIMQISRQKVNRVLKKCVELGIVKIEIEKNYRSKDSIEDELKRLFGLKRVILASGEKSERELLGEAGAKYIASVIDHDYILGFSHGHPILHLASAIAPANKENINVFQLVGCLSHKNICISSNETTSKISAALRASYFGVHKRLTTEGGECGCGDEYLDIADNCDIAVVEIGSKGQCKKLYERQIISRSECDAIMGSRAVGNIAFRFYDAEGNVIPFGFEKRLLGITYRNFLKIPCRVGLAVTRENTDFVIGALKGGHINVLVVTAEHAKKIIEHYNNEEKQRDE